jgi:hypothetical protein
MPDRAAGPLVITTALRHSAQGCLDREILLIAADFLFLVIERE